MATPIIQSVGSVSGAGTPGEGRNDLVAGETITLSDAEPANSTSTHFWQFEDTPLDTNPTLLNPTTATPSFVVDADPGKAGSYRIRCTVDGIESSVEVLAKPLRRTGSRVPSFQERLEYSGGGNTKGWHESQTRFMRKVDEFLRNPGPGGAGDEMIYSLWSGGRESHDGNTPLVVGAFAFNPSDYSLINTVVEFRLVVVAACGGTPLVGHVKLYNVTDREVVTSSVISVVDSTNPTRYTATLLLGTAAGKIKTTGEKIYECRIYIDTPPDPDAVVGVKSIELYKAEVQAVFTIQTTDGSSSGIAGEATPVLMVVQDEGVALGTFGTINFVGGNVSASDAGGGVAEVTIPAPAVTVQEEGVEVGAFGTINFVGAGVTATDAGGGVTDITIPGSPGAAVFVWTIAKTWAQVFAEMQAVSGPKICLVEYDPAATNGRNMTRNTDLSPTDLNDIYFMALFGNAPTPSPGSSTSAYVRINFADGLVFAQRTMSGGSGDWALLRSKDIYWRSNSSSALFVGLGAGGTGSCLIDLDGGRLEAFNIVVDGAVVIQMKNNARMTTLGSPMFKLYPSGGGGGSLRMMSHSLLANGIFFAATGTPIVSVTMDTTCQYNGPIGGAGTTFGTNVSASFSTLGLPAIDGKTITGSGTTTSPFVAPGVFIWKTSQSWATIYAAMNAVPGPKICLVEYSVAGRTITSGAYDLNDITFMGPGGSSEYMGTVVTINVNAGFTFVDRSEQYGKVVRLTSKDIKWNFQALAAPAYTAVDPYSDYVYVTLDGGSIYGTEPPGMGSTTMANVIGVVRGTAFVVLKNFALIDGVLCVVTASGGFSSLAMTGQANSGACFVDDGNGNDVVVFADSTCHFDPTVFTGYGLSVTFQMQNSVKVGSGVVNVAFPNDATKYLDGTGNFTVPSGGGGLSDGDKGDITVSGSGATWTIDTNVVDLTKLAQIATATFLGRTTAGTGNVEALTATQATALLNTFTSGAKGLAPASGGGTTNFLRADGTWAAPPGGGGGGGEATTTVSAIAFSTPSGTVNLSTEGTQDWLKFGWNPNAYDHARNREATNTEVHHKKTGGTPGLSLVDTLKATHGSTWPQHSSDTIAGLTMQTTAADDSWGIAANDTLYSVFWSDNALMLDYGWEWSIPAKDVSQTVKVYFAQHNTTIVLDATVQSSDVVVSNSNTTGNTGVNALVLATFTISAGAKGEMVKVRIRSTTNPNANGSLCMGAITIAT